VSTQVRREVIKYLELQRGREEDRDGDPLGLDDGEDDPAGGPI